MLQTVFLKIYQTDSLVAFGLGVCMLSSYYVLYVTLFSSLRNIPGPLLARLTPLRAIYQRLPSRVIDAALHDFNTYGDIYISKPNTITICNPQDVRTVLGSSIFRKIDMYHGVHDPALANIVTFSDPAMASRRRRQLAPYFTSSYLLRMESIILQKGAKAIGSKWHSLLDGRDTAVVNYRNDTQLATFSIMATLAFGRSTGDDSLESADSRIIGWISSTAVYVGLRMNFPLLLKFPLSILLRPSLTAYADFLAYSAESVKRRKQLLDKQVSPEKHQAEALQVPEDMLQAFIKAQDPESKIVMTAKEVQAESLGMQLAGSETTAAALTWALHLFTLYPHYRARAETEVRSRFAKGHLISYTECRVLEFLEAFIYEMFRYTPITSGFMPQFASTDVVLQGYLVPAGTHIAFNLIALNNRTDVWAEPNKFRPERFLEDTDKKRYVFAFSYGVRNCLGRNLAWMEILPILANLLNEFDMEGIGNGSEAFRPHGRRDNGEPALMPSKCHIVFAPKYPERDCRILIRK
ncbi:cytochrome P450, partial [Pseudovirgaria hyperparasitica]